MLGAHANAAPAHERIGLTIVGEILDVLVAAEVEGADDDGAVGRSVNHLFVGFHLFVFGRHCGMGEEHILGAEKPDAGCAHARRGGRVDHRVDVGQEFDGFAVLGDRVEFAVLH
jgi:hypothetical protein